MYSVLLVIKKILPLGCKGNFLSQRLCPFLIANVAMCPIFSLMRYWHIIYKYKSNILVLLRISNRGNGCISDPHILRTGGVCVTDAFESDMSDIDWLLAEFGEFQQELQKVQNERVSRSSPFNFTVSILRRQRP